MNIIRIALANIRFPQSPDDSVRLVEQSIVQAAAEKADIICFPECYVPGHRAPGKSVPPPDPKFLENAWRSVAATAAKVNVAVVLGTERMVEGELLASALIIDRDGTISGFQDKIQIAPEEEGLYAAGSKRQVFQNGQLKFGVVICHEAWRYPETVRWLVRRGAQVVFHLQFHEAKQNSYRPTSFADPANSFHEKALLCRAAENTCYFASVNYASAGSPTTSAIVDPEGNLLGYQPYGRDGLLIVDVDLDRIAAEYCQYLAETLDEALDLIKVAQSKNEALSVGLVGNAAGIAAIFHCLSANSWMRHCGEGNSRIQVEKALGIELISHALNWNEPIKTRR
jgi:predicted amidohydrolase